MNNFIIKKINIFLYYLKIFLIENKLVYATIYTREELIIDKKKTCMILSAILVVLSFISSFIEENINLTVGIVILILSIIILVIAANYSKEYKNNYDKNHNKKKSFIILINTNSFL